jgi:hypothetical protein
MSSPRRLTLVLGDGTGPDGGRSSAPLILLTPVAPLTPPATKGAVQLTIPVLTQRQETVISASSDGLSLSNLNRILGSTGARRIVDIRASPSFQSPRCPSGEFFRMVAEHRVTYQHLPELANPFIPESWSDTGSLTRYRMFVQATGKAHLLRLRDQLRSGAMLLISRSPSHDGSDRECVVDELAAIDSDFDLTITQW